MPIDPSSIEKGKRHMNTPVPASKAHLADPSILARALVNGFGGGFDGTPVPAPAPTPSASTCTPPRTIRDDEPMPVVTDTTDDGRPVPVGLDLTSRDTGTARLIYPVRPDYPYGDTPLTQGVRARVAIGESYGDNNVWYYEAEVLLAIAVTEQGGPPVLVFQRDAGDTVSVKHGYEKATATWWRYSHEADPREYREHCLRIVEILGNDSTGASTGAATGTARR